MTTLHYIAHDLVKLGIYAVSIWGAVRFVDIAVCAHQFAETSRIHEDFCKKGKK